MSNSLYYGAIEHCHVRQDRNHQGTKDTKGKLKKTGFFVPLVRRTAKSGNKKDRQGRQGNKKRDMLLLFAYPHFSLAFFGVLGGSKMRLCNRPGALGGSMLHVFCYVKK